ncbi:MAG TPA: glycosyltransferase family 2 protein [Candidatus Hydrogenedentes bacterium]|nr:glycosyltransferase family 2 protein [Candidatus Hydrogenedentota bacterium]
MKTVTLVAPCYDEVEVLPEFYARVRQLANQLPQYKLEILFVNDGSRDGTDGLLDSLAAQDPYVKVLHFARNRGHQVALTAGLDFAEGDVIVTMDADLQDPPEVIPELLTKIEEGFDIVHAQRSVREGETRFKLATAHAFYRLLNAIAHEPLIEDYGDFRAFTRPVLMAVRGFREQHRFLRGTFVLLGFRQAVLPYHRAARSAGRTKFPLRKMLSFAVDGIVSFSSAPLRSLLWFAFILWGVSLAFTARALIGHFIFRWTVPGWTSLVVLLTFFTGLNLFSLSVVGLYVGRTFEQGQHRPLYWCRATRNIDLRALPYSPEIELSRRILGLNESPSSPTDNDHPE